MPSDYVTLLGAEDVRSAANTISGAASEMRSAASMIDSTVREFKYVLADAITAMNRLSDLLEQQKL